MIVTNYAFYPFSGWVRGVTSRWHGLPEVGTFSQPLSNTFVLYRLGEPLGHGFREIDLFVDLGPGGSLTVDMSQPTASHEAKPPVAMLPPDSERPQVDGRSLEVVSCRHSGAFTTTHYRARLLAPVNQMVLDVIDVRGLSENWARLEIALTCSEPDTEVMSTRVLKPLVLRMGDRQIGLHGKRGDATMLDVGEALAEGQGRSFSGATLVTSAISSFAWATMPISVIDPESNWSPVFGGKPPTTGSQGVDMLQWLRSRLSAVLQGLWNVPMTPLLPVANNSGVTGGQEDQGCGHLAFRLPRGQGAELIRYFAAARYFMRPCHFLEADGSPIRPERHQDLGMWDMQPDPRWSQDLRGKPRQPTLEETQGHWGADWEHMWFNTLAEAALTTGSPLLQRELEITARNWLFQVTIDERMNTTALAKGGMSARALACICWTFCQFWWSLKDRDLAQQLMDRMRQWLAMVMQHNVNGPTGQLRGDLWDIRPADARHNVAPARWVWMSYQQCIGVFGLYVAGRLVGDLEAVQHALRGARACVRYAWPNDLATELLGLQTDDPVLPQTDAPVAMILPSAKGLPGQVEDSPSDDEVRAFMRDHGVDTDSNEILTQWRTGWFEHAWMPWGLWVALTGLPQGDPDQVHAARLWARTGHPGGTGLYPWIPPV